ncbi:uncharacterized protein LAESUDRAFT_719641 [Laetiporus sulphureus 93-53]|uniref:MARVEL domain-containing protein n=1 Tax=Laetiporus sulphureus 93-53 TaxID=1314785 RepID=A0A165IMH2_9APHY|nr:uncharacterized protein LAESUDRAFT_719641 [Laetiporus sulphureus 93-53]KZT13284.1 hypothetical protein LAESUDRAFT_719641 [Laetiporus sulphureus 93-53]
MRPAALRLPLYIALWIFSIILLILTAVRLNYTLHLPKGDPLDGGTDFYDPIVAELLVCSVLTLGFALFVFRPPVSLFAHLFPDVSIVVIEVIALAVLWFLWLIGSGIATSIWPNLSWCYQYSACRVLSAMTAFAWLGWLALCGLLVVGMFAVLQKRRAPQFTVEIVQSTAQTPSVMTQV